MIAFASVSTAWNPLDSKVSKNKNNLMSMSLTLMSSRLALAIQYGVATVYALRHNHGATALLIHTLTMVGAACAYLGVSAGSRHFAGKILIRCIALLQFPERCCAENIRSMVCMPCHQIF